MILATTDNLEHLIKMIDLAKSKDSQSEEILIINNIKWLEFEKLLEAVGDESGILFRYLGGKLEIMSPSSIHEVYKKTIGMLLENYLLENKIRFYPLGSTTLKNQALGKGIEPDQCYCINNRKAIPDLAIEVVITSGGIDCLELYQGLGVAEVWFWEKEKLSVYVLKKGEYIQVNQSSLLPNLDLDLFASYITYDEPFDAVLEFRERIKALKSG